jgi:hypothetical protein
MLTLHSMQILAVLITCLGILSALILRRCRLLFYVYASVFNRSEPETSMLTNDASDSLAKRIPDCSSENRYQ